jgi:hypothetical protein
LGGPRKRDWKKKTNRIQVFSKPKKKKKKRSIPSSHLLTQVASKIETKTPSRGVNVFLLLALVIEIPKRRKVGGFGELASKSCAKKEPKSWDRSQP